MERLAYLLKNRFPGLFRPVEGLARSVTILRFSRRRERALANARIEGTVGGRPAAIRPLDVGDVARLTNYPAWPADLITENETGWAVPCRRTIPRPSRKR
jgi:hypothetical protein